MAKRMQAEQNWTSLSPNEAYFQAALQLAEFELINEEIPSPEESEGNEELDRKILNLIEGQIKKNHRAKMLKTNAGKIAKMAALTLLLLNLCLTVAYAANSEFRNRVYQFFIETYPIRTEITLINANEETKGSHPSDFIPKYRAFWLPDSSYRIVDTHEMTGYWDVHYKAENGGEIILTVVDEDGGTLSINTEGMKQSSISVSDRTMDVFHKNSEYYLVWYNEVEITYYVVYTQNITFDDAIRIALSVGEADV